MRRGADGSPDSPASNEEIRVLRKDLGSRRLALLTGIDPSTGDDNRQTTTDRKKGEGLQQKQQDAQR